MAQTFDEIAEILNEISKKNDSDLESLRKALTEINLKLAVVTDTTESADMVRYYISELKNLMDKRFDSSELKFDELKKQFNEISLSDYDIATKSELKELFDSFSLNFSKFLSETADRRSILENISAKIDNIGSESFYDSEIIDKVSSVSRDLISMDEKIESIFSAVSLLIKNINNSDKFEEIKTQLNQVTDKLSRQINSVSSNFASEEIEQKIEECKSLTSTLIEEFHQNASVSVDNSLKLVNEMNYLSEKLENVQDVLSSNAGTNFENLKLLISDLSSKSDELKISIAEVKSGDENEIINSKLDNFAELLEVIKELVTELSINDEIKLLGSNTDLKFENLAGCVNEIKTSFENNSKLNYENLLSAIDNIKTEINSGIEAKYSNINFDYLTNVLDELSGNVELLRDFSSKRSQEIVDNISNELHSITNDTIQKINTDSELNFGELKASLEKITAELDSVKSDFIKINDSTTYNISTGFSDVNAKFENIFAGIYSLGENLESDIKESNDNIINKFNDLNVEIDDLKKEINDSAEINRIVDLVGIVSAKIDELVEKDSNSEDFAKIKDALTIIKSEIDISREEYLGKLKENIGIQSEQIKNISENIMGLKDYISELDLGLKDYVSKLDIVKSSDISDLTDKTTQKLLDLEASLVQNANGYDVQFENLQSKLVEFFHIVEGSNSDMEGKILNSSEKVELIKEELVSLKEDLKEINSSNSEKLSETISLLDAGVENIVFNINNISESLKNGVDESVKNNITSLDEKFDEFSTILSSLNSDLIQSDVKIVENISEKMISLKDEISSVNSDIIEALRCKTDDILKALELLGQNLDAFADIDIEKSLKSFKSEFELSFMNFISDLGNEFDSNSEMFSNIKETYRDILNKISIVEEVVNNTLQNNIEMLNVSLESGLKGLNSQIDEKFENHLNSMKMYFDVAFNNTKTNELINELKDQLLSTNREIIKNCSNESVKSLVEELKLDNTDIKGGLEAVDSKIEKLKDTTNLLSALNVKMDVLASDDFDNNLMDEIDEIKGIIFEQRKYFEEASDEKSAAIDKYLRDVLVKLDNVDIEKSSEDIKDSVLNAILSLSDQISFVEEAEEIKDFVEEKTDSIHQSILEVNKKLKQLTSGDDDFEYTYTLQDVESDIAKLRLAMNNISSGKFEDISDEIKRIVTSVENLESNLTQDQIIDLKTDIEKLNDDIVSISSRTNKLLLNSDESYKAVNDGLNNFSDLIVRLEDRINYLDNTAITERLEKKVDNIQSLANSVVNSNKVINQVMMYLGEWVDSTTQDISSISENLNTVSEKLDTVSDNTSKFDDINTAFDQIKELIPDNTELVDLLMNKFEKQEARIDSLERKLDKILSTLEEKDDMVLNRKVDKIEKMLSGLGASIEKLTSYVDEE